MPDERVEQKDLQNLEIPEEEMLAFESEEAYEASLKAKEDGEKPPEEKPPEELSEEEKAELAAKAKEEPPKEPPPPPEPPSEEELVLEMDGKKYDEEYLTEAVKDRQNKENWQKKNTERAQELAAIRKSLEAVKGELSDKELLESLDEYYGGKDDNPFRRVDLTASLEPKVEPPPEESKTDVEKRLDALDKDKAERDRVTAEKEAQAKAHDQVGREIVSLTELDPSLKKDEAKLQKIAERALEMDKANPEGSPPTRLVDAWLDLYGKKQLGLEKVQKKAKDTNEVVGGPGARTTTPKTPAGDIHKARDNALEEYLSMGE